MRPDLLRWFCVRFSIGDFFKPSLEGGRLMVVLLRASRCSGAPILKHLDDLKLVQISRFKVSHPCSLIQKEKNRGFRTINHIIVDLEIA